MIQKSIVLIFLASALPTYTKISDVAQAYDFLNFKLSHDISCAQLSEYCDERKIGQDQRDTIDTSSDSVLLISTHEMRNSYISFVNVNGVMYLVKQKKRASSGLSVVLELLAAYIAKVLHIAHIVDVIHASKEFPGKKRNVPATIHTIAQGVVVRNLENAHPYRKLRLKQYLYPTLPDEKRGLTRAIVSQMTLHKLIPIIVALDTFLGNADRHGGNLTYDHKTDSFCAIDMDNSFRHDLSDLAYRHLTQMMHEKKNPLSAKEIEALKIYRDTLKKLLKTFSCSHLQDSLFYFAQKAGVIPGTVFYKVGNAGKKLLFCKEMIAHNYNGSKKLIKILNEIIHRKYKG